MIVLDTHIFLWMNLDQERLPVHILNAIGSEAQLGISAISLWETAMLVQYGRVSIPNESFMTWLRTALNATKLRVLPITPEIAARSGMLEMHGAPDGKAIENLRYFPAFDELLHRVRDAVGVQTVVGEKLGVRP